MKHLEVCLYSSFIHHFKQLIFLLFLGNDAVRQQAVKNAEKAREVRGLLTNLKDELKTDSRENYELTEFVKEVDHGVEKLGDNITNLIANNPGKYDEARIEAAEAVAAKTYAVSNSSRNTVMEANSSRAFAELVIHPAKALNLGISL